MKSSEFNVEIKEQTTHLRNMLCLHGAKQHLIN
jgi:hypothetical protein